MAKGKGYAVVIVKGVGDPHTAPTLPLVAALIALDCYPRTDCPFQDIFEPGATDEEPDTREHVWTFHEASACGRYKTDQLRKWWHNLEWLAVNPGHPLALIRGYFHADGVLPIEESADLPLVANCLRATAEQRGKLPAIWHDKQFRRSKIGHTPLAIVACAFALLPQLRAELQKSVLLIRVRRGESQVLIPSDAAPEEEKVLLDKLEKKK